MHMSLMLVDDQPLFRHGIRALLQSCPSCHIAAEAGSFEQMLARLRHDPPDCALMEIDIASGGAARAVETVREIAPHCRVIALTLNTQRSVISGVVAAGVAGYVLKSGPPEDLLSALNVVASGQTYLSPAVATILVGAYRASASNATPDSPFGTLTNREREVMTLLVEGNTTKQIAFKLNVSAKTVASHKDSIMNKVRTRSIALLTRYAISEGIVT